MPYIAVTFQSLASADLCFAFPLLFFAVLLSASANPLSAPCQSSHRNAFAVLAFAVAIRYIAIAIHIFASAKHVNAHATLSSVLAFSLPFFALADQRSAIAIQCRS